MHIGKAWFLVVVGVAQVLPSLAGSGDLDGAQGRLFQPDLAARSFELLKATEYDPQTDVGKSRFTIHWTVDTEIVELSRRRDFPGLTAPMAATIEEIGPFHRERLKSGQDFKARRVVLHAGEDLSRPAEGPAEDFSSVTGTLTATAGERSARLTLGDDSVTVSLQGNRSEVVAERSVTPQRFAKGFWKVVVHGAPAEDGFVASRLEIEEIPDPRADDDPDLPRVLVIGDSISMNYDEAAREALKGLANYHRIEGNAFSSRHGVQNTELWLGEHERDGFGWDVIQFNHGLHDLKQSYDKESDTFGDYAISLKEYQKNLERQVRQLSRTGAQLIWCTTTPVPNDNKSRYARRDGAAKLFNQAAREVISRHPEIQVTDLYGLIESSPVFDEWRKTKDVHFYGAEERRVLGRAVAMGIRAALSKVEH